MTQRGRPSKGANARTVTASVKVTRTEADNLTLRYGTTTAGLRHLLDTVLHGIAAEPAKPHRHVRGMQVESRWEEGTEIPVYECAHEGCSQRLSGR